MTTMPDFEEWATKTYGAHTEIAQALKQAFDQGYALGYREAVEVEQERLANQVMEEDKEVLSALSSGEQWYDAIDGDVAEYARWQDNEVLKNANPGVIQKKDPASGCYVARYVATGIEIGRRCGGQPFANIQIEE